MLTLVPNPSIRHWIRFLKFFNKSTKNFLEPWADGESVTGVLSKSMWSIALIAHWRSRFEQNQSVVLLVPDYFCNSALLPTRMLGHQICLYRVRSDLTIDIGEFRENCKEIRPSLVIVPNYFGVKFEQIADVAEISRLNGAWLIEDCAHCLLPEATIGKYGDFVLFSPHKSIPTPSGAILSLRSDGPCRLGAELKGIVGSSTTWQSQITQIAREAKIPIGNKQIYDSIWLFKRIIQLLGLWRRPRNPDVGFFDDQDVARLSMCSPSIGWLAKASLNFHSEPAHLGILARCFLPESKFANGLQLEARRRRNMVGIWDQLISALSNDEVSPLINDATSMTPYLAYYEGSEAVVSDLYQKLKLLGLPVTSWPDLPPETSRFHQESEALKLRNSRLYLPLHRSIKKREISRICEQAANTKYIKQSVVSQRAVNEKLEWEDLLKRTKFSNLLQSWSYGEAKYDVEGWMVARRVFFSNGREIAICQSLYRRLFGVFSVVRVGRGPLFLGDVDSNERLSVFDEIARYGKWYRLRFVSMSAESYLRPWREDSLSLNLKQLSVLGSSSIVLDLTRTIESRRKSMKGKWRNQLNASERNGVHVRLSRALDDFVEFESHYAALVEEKNFDGLDIALLRSIWLHANELDNAFLFVAEYEDINQAAILVVSHGSTATYLAGWNGVVGRNLNCNNLLLWTASCVLADLGFKFFDLGGIDEIETPSISSFKAGMGGETYLTAGEYISL